jgi:hypothetical protein
MITIVTAPEAPAPTIDIVSGLTIALIAAITVEMTAITKQIESIFLVFDIIASPPLFIFMKNRYRLCVFASGSWITVTSI